MIGVPEPASKNWRFCLQTVPGTGQAYQTFLEKTLKWKEVSADYQLQKMCGEILY